MNKDTIIWVKTAVRETDEKETGANITQGTQEGAANIEYSVNKFFRESEDKLSYGSIKIQTLLLMI